MFTDVSEKGEAHFALKDPQHCRITTHFMASPKRPVPRLAPALTEELPAALKVCTWLLHCHLHAVPCNAAESKFFKAFCQPISNDEVISPLVQEICQRAKVLDSQEIWNILRAETKSKLAQPTVSQKVLAAMKLLDEHLECKRVTEEKNRTMLQRCRVILMFKASEFNLDRTTLLIANNPLQTADDPAGTDSPTKYLHTYTHPPIQKGAPDLTSSCKLPPLKRPITSNSPRQERAGSVVSRGTVSAFLRKTEARKNRCETHLGHLDRSGAKSGSCLSREPLTISALMKNSTAVTVPGQGAFRHGQATFWNIDSSYASPP